MPPTRGAGTHAGACPRPRFRPSQQECEPLTAAFGAAAQRGDTQGLAELLAEDVTFI